jgi:hypothetical protein
MELLAKNGGVHVLATERQRVDAFVKASRRERSADLDRGRA